MTVFLPIDCYIFNIVTSVIKSHLYTEIKEVLRRFVLTFIFPILIDTLRLHYFPFLLLSSMSKKPKRHVIQNT